jgi:hypothetical protein
MIRRGYRSNVNMRIWKCRLHVKKRDELRCVEEKKTKETKLYLGELPRKDLFVGGKN